jgi:hypothetical protein
MEPSDDYTAELQARLEQYQQKLAAIRDAWYAFDRPSSDAAGALVSAQFLGRVILSPVADVS